MMPNEKVEAHGNEFKWAQCLFFFSHLAKSWNQHSDQCGGPVNCPSKIRRLSPQELPRARELSEATPAIVTSTSRKSSLFNSNSIQLLAIRRCLSQHPFVFSFPHYTLTKSRDILYTGWSLLFETYNLSRFFISITHRSELCHC